MGQFIMVNPHWGQAGRGRVPAGVAPTVVLVALYNQESLGIRTLHAKLEAEGISVVTLFFKERWGDNTFEPCTENEIAHLIAEVAALRPRLVGISVMSAFFELASGITADIQALPDAPLVLWGGIHPTLKPEQCAKVADMVCVGEGEGPIVDVVRRLQEGGAVDNIPNLRVGAVENALRPLTQDLDCVPFPATSPDNKWVVQRGEVYPYDYNDVIRKHGFRFLTNLGCPYKCSFCANSILRETYKDKGKYTRQRSVSVIMDELVRLKEAYDLGPGYILFQDEVFAPNLAWAEEFAREYKRRVNKNFWCYGHPGAIRESIVKVLRGAGLGYMQFGIQAGSEEMRSAYLARTGSNDRIVESANILNKHRVAWGIDLLMENPIETEEDRVQTLKLLLRLPRPFEVNTHTLTFFPEYPLSDQLLAAGAITEDDLEDCRSESFKHNRWNPQLDESRDPTNMLWSSLYHLASIPCFPDKIILACSRNEVLQREPRPLLVALKVFKAGGSLRTLIKAVQAVPYQEREVVPTISLPVFQ